MSDLALSKGFPATTVDEVCKRAGVTKGSFYHHFGGKDDLGTTALQAYFDELKATFGAGAWIDEPDPVRRLRAFIAHAADVSTGPVMIKGCLLGSFALDLAESSPDVRERLSAMFVELRNMVADLIEPAARASGARLDAHALGDQFIAVLEGSIVLAKAHADPSATERGIWWFGQCLDLLLASGEDGRRSAPRRRAPDSRRR